MCPLHFVWSESVAERAAAAFAEHERRIHARLPGARIRHTGGSSVPGVLTSGDVDLQVSVDEESFAATRDVLSELYEPLYRDAWSGDAAYFTTPGADPPVEVALTTIGTLDDWHHGGVWDRIAADSKLIEEYNALKRAHAGGSAEDYNTAKRAFFYAHFPPQAAPNARNR